jgi:hypothetical protein
MTKYLGYAAYILAIIAGARNITLLVIVFLALGVTLLFARKRRNVDLSRPSAGKQNPFVDGIYFFAIQLLIMFVAYLIGVFAASSAGEMFGMFISGKQSLSGS